MLPDADMSGRSVPTAAGGKSRDRLDGFDGSTTDNAGRRTAGQRQQSDGAGGEGVDRDDLVLQRS